jgi:hypothetical protein
VGVREEGPISGSEGGNISLIMGVREERGPQKIHVVDYFQSSAT